MTPEETAVVLARRDANARWNPNLTPDEVDFRAAEVARELVGAPISWALKCVMERAIAGAAPTDAELIRAWRAHSTALSPEGKRLLGLAPPSLPVVARESTGLSAVWERTRRVAIAQGAGFDEATAAADAAVGGTRPVGDAVDPNEVLGALRALARATSDGDGEVAA